MKLLIVCGPTATGKTALALNLARKFHGELVSADSRQMYKGLDALTGKERSNDIAIWLYDIIETGETCSAHDFVSRAAVAIADIHNRGKLPIVVGGTGYYLRALITPFDTISVPPNVELRKKLAASSLAALQAELKRADGARWERMNDSDRKNPRRLVRAIEVAKTGNIVHPVHPQYEALWVGLTASPQWLKERIEKRVNARFGKAVDEVRDGMELILGAPPLLALLRGEISKEQAQRTWVSREYQYAKRQLTWFKKQKGIHWFDIQDSSFSQQVEALVSEWYTSK